MTLRILVSAFLVVWKSPIETIVEYDRSELRKSAMQRRFEVGIGPNKVENSPKMNKTGIFVTCSKFPQTDCIVGPKM